MHSLFSFKLRMLTVAIPLLCYNVLSLASLFKKEIMQQNVKFYNSLRLGSNKNKESEKDVREPLKLTRKEKSHQISRHKEKLPVKSNLSPVKSRNTYYDHMSVLRTEGKKPQTGRV